MKTPIYYIIMFEEIYACYLIKEGYIPCKDYFENENHEYYGAYSREEFCIAYPSDTKGIYEDLELAKKECKRRIEEKFINQVKDLIEDRQELLEKLEKLEKDNALYF